MVVNMYPSKPVSSSIVNIVEYFFDALLLFCLCFQLLGLREFSTRICRRFCSLYSIRYSQVVVCIVCSCWLDSFVI